MSGSTSISTGTPTIVQRLRALGAGGRRLRRGWSRQRVAELVKTLGYVMPLTLLIWVWAQDQQIDVDPRQAVPVRIGHTDAGKVVSIRGTATGESLGQTGSALRVNLTFQGPRIGLSAVARDLSESTIASALEIRLSRPVGESTVFLRDELNQLPLLRSAGVTVREANPASIIVGIEDRQQIEVRIAAANVGPDDVTGPVEFDPETVMLTGPASALRALQAIDGVPVLRANIPDTAPGEQEVRVAVPVPDETGAIRSEPPEVLARFNRRERREEKLTLPFPVPVYTTVPAALSVEPEALNPVINSVRVRGPADLIARLRNVESPDEALRAQIRAVVALTREDEVRVGQQVTRDVKLELPDGLLPDGEPPKTTFTLRRRADSL